VTPLSCRQSRVWIDCVGDIVVRVVYFSLQQLGFWYQRSEKYKSASPHAIQLKNWQKTVGTEEKIDIISQLEKGERIVDLQCNVEFACSRSMYS